MRTTKFLPYAPYAIAAVLNLIGDLAHAPDLARCSQWALMPLLIVAVLATLRPLRTPAALWLIAGLAFSWAGDVLLGVSFVLGLGAFLLAQLGFIVAFTRKPIAGGNAGWRRRNVILYVVLYLVLLGLLAAHVGAMLPAVVVYGAALCSMAAVAGRTSRVLEIAGLVFVLSDGLLALQLFRPDLAFPLSGFWVMLTYIVAEAGIAVGVTLAVKRSHSDAPILWADAATSS
jgi:uncharacterized membrane protein YhhN